jgi:hypothetical protein
MAHAGLLALAGEDRPIRVQVDFTADQLLVTVPAGSLGAWPLSSCRIESEGDQFRIEVDGDVAWFQPDEPASFARDSLAHLGAGGLVGAISIQSSGEAPRVAIPETGPEPPPEPAPKAGSVWGRLEEKQRNLILAGSALLVTVLLIAGLNRGSAAPVAPTATVALATTTTSAPAFLLDLAEISMRWNRVAADLNTDMFIPGTPTSNRMEVELTAGITLYATVDPGTDRVRTLMIAAGPARGDQGQVVLVAWGTLIAMVNPELSPEQRGELLGRLGVEVDRPLQLGLSTEAEVGGARYWLASGVLGGRALLGVELDG